jgi:Skp family chaperone for outer membrane proteins
MSTRYIRFIAALISGFAVAGVSAAAVAQKVPAPIVAVVDYQVILRDSKAIKSIRDQAEIERKKLQSKATEQEKRVRTNIQTLEKQRAVLSPAAFSQKQRVLNAEIAEIQRQNQVRRRQLRQAFGKAEQKFEAALVKLVAVIAKEKGYNMVFNRRQMIFAAPQFDITDLALKRLNKQLPTLKVEVPAN